MSASVVQTLKKSSCAQVVRLKMLLDSATLIQASLPATVVEAWFASAFLKRNDVYSKAISMQQEHFEARSLSHPVECLRILR